MRFSLVIPVAPDRNAEILSSINNLDFPKKDFEVIVEKGTNPSDNRNRGFEKAKGKIIVLLDDDAVLEKDYLIKAKEFFEKYPSIDIVGGPQLTPKNEKGFAKISGYALSSKFGAWKLSGRYSPQKEIMDVDETSLTSANLICKKEVMKKVKFDSSLFPGEDPKFISDAKKENFRVAYSPSIILYHRRRGSIKALIKQMFNYGKARPAKEKFRETLKKPFFLVPSLFFLYLLWLIATSMWGGFSVLAAVPLLIYFIIAVLFSFYDSAKNKNLLSFFVLPFIYLAIHLSYGAGMIWGYIRK